MRAIEVSHGSLRVVSLLELLSLPLASTYRSRAIEVFQGSQRLLSPLGPISWILDLTYLNVAIEVNQYFQKICLFLDVMTLVIDLTKGIQAIEIGQGSHRVFWEYHKTYGHLQRLFPLKHIENQVKKGQFSSANHSIRPSLSHLWVTSP